MVPFAIIQGILPVLWLTRLAVHQVFLGVILLLFHQEIWEGHKLYSHNFNYYSKAQFVQAFGS